MRRHLQAGHPACRGASEIAQPIIPKLFTALNLLPPIATTAWVRHVADRVLNRISGTISGVAAVYNRLEYLDECRAAVEAWGKFVAGLVHPESTRRNGVTLRA